MKESFTGAAVMVAPVCLMYYNESMLEGRKIAGEYERKDGYEKDT